VDSSSFSAAVLAVWDMLEGPVSRNVGGFTCRSPKEGWYVK